MAAAESGGILIAYEGLKWLAVAGGTLIVGLIGYIFKNQNEAIKENRNDIDEIKDDLSQANEDRVELKTDMKHVKSDIGYIRQSLETLAKK